MRGWLQGVKQAGVLGLNRRNIDYMLAANPRRNYPLVDDKQQTKQLAQRAGIPIPPLYGVIKIQRQVRDLAGMVEGHGDFVIKPANGSGGNGIVVIDGRKSGLYRKVNGEWLTEHELQHHISNILGGMYSLGGITDKALIEYRVHFDPVFTGITYQGVPDIRIVVYQGVPVMAMLRLPTRQSEGRANLHQGAVGAGIDLASGVTLYAVMGHRIITRHPDTDEALADVQVPYWDKLLLTAAQCYELTGMGYIGADFVLDSELGPLLLELNARPGLNIQIANASGLQPRLAQVAGGHTRMMSVPQRVDFARRHFAA
jgi:alpha-L-glutamate ligase-like protein